jgi:hypothetical protein
VTIPQQTTTNSSQATTAQRFTYLTQVNHDNIMSAAWTHNMFGFGAMPSVPATMPTMVTDNPFFNKMANTFDTIMQHFTPVADANHATPMTNVNAMNHVDARRHNTMPRLTASTDIRHWFERYDIHMAALHYKMSVRDLTKAKLLQLPLYLDDHLTNIWDSMSAEHKESLDTVRTHLTSLFQDRGLENAWSKLRSTNKKPTESYEAFARRCKANFDNVNRQSQDTAPTHLLMERLINNAPIASKTRIAEAQSFEDALKEFCAIDKINRYMNMNNTSQPNPAIMQKLQELDAMKAKVALLEAEQRTLQANPATIPPHIDNRIPPEHKRDRTPKNPKHQNNICYRCQDPQADHLSYNCPYPPNSRGAHKPHGMHKPPNRQYGYNKPHRHNKHRHNVPPPGQRQQGGNKRKICQYCAKMHTGECSHKHVYERGLAAAQQQLDPQYPQKHLQPTALFPPHPAYSSHTPYRYPPFHLQPPPTFSAFNAYPTALMTPPPQWTPPPNFGPQFTPHKKHRSDAHMNPDRAARMAEHDGGREPEQI